MTWHVVRKDNGRYMFRTDGGFYLWTEQSAYATPYVDSTEAGGANAPPGDRHLLGKGPGRNRGGFVISSVIPPPVYKLA